ncbi:MAG: PIN domain-containing protein [Chloroflexi bacterium]|nr:PIN domain-containing protein [Chloroflexota bacterium]
MTDAKAFVDTNVLLRSFQATMPLHDEALALITKARNDGYELWVSRQVMREYIVQITRPGVLTIPFDAEQVMAKVKIIRATFQIADETEAVTDQLIELIREFPTGGKQIHDANIIATMLVYGIDTLLTQNIEDMKRFSSKIKLVPLVPNTL